VRLINIATYIGDYQPTITSTLLWLISTANPKPDNNSNPNPTNSNPKP